MKNILQFYLYLYKTEDAENQICNQLCLPNFIDFT